MQTGESRKHDSSKARTEKSVGHDFEALSGRILDAAVAVHRALGPGFLESVYENALVVAFEHRGIRFEQQREVRVSFEGEEVGLHRLDLLVEGEIVLEIKAVKALEDVHFAQLKSYLKATHLHIGLLLNFNAPTLIVKRVVL
ncbi:MAG: GxxExxY protein [Deltaproteobacteria bacterium]|nr:GxxExxY protein [Deltaproteobacteria bacterium]